MPRLHLGERVRRAHVLLDLSELLSDLRLLLRREGRVPDRLVTSVRQDLPLALELCQEVGRIDVPLDVPGPPLDPFYYGRPGEGFELLGRTLPDDRRGRVAAERTLHYERGPGRRVGDAAPAVVVEIESALPGREPTLPDCLDDRVPEKLLQPHDASVRVGSAAQPPNVVSGPLAQAPPAHAPAVRGREQVLAERSRGRLCRVGADARYGRTSRSRHEHQTLRHRAHHKLMQALLEPEIFEGAVTVQRTPASSRSARLKLVRGRHEFVICPASLRPR